MTLCTRGLDSAQSFALDYQLTLKDRAELQNWHHYDAVIAATNSEDHLITSMPMHSKTKLILDLSVPRSVEPSLNRHTGLTLLNMEEIGAFFENYRSLRLSEVETIKQYLQNGIERYTALYEKKSLLPVSR